MAIVKFGPTVVGARGTIAGTIFSANKSGPFVRAWSKGANQKSELQSAHRNTLGDIASTWRDLSQAQRDDWIDYADDPAQEKTNSLGETFSASGFNWFVEINLNLEAAGAARRVDAPTFVPPVAPIISFFTFDTGAANGRAIIGLAVASPGLAEQHNVVLRTVSSVGITAVAANFAFMINEVPDGSRFLIFNDEAVAKFGPVVVGQRGFVLISVQDSQGRRGPTDSINTDAVTFP